MQTFTVKMASACSCVGKIVPGWSQSQMSLLLEERFRRSQSHFTGVLTPPWPDLCKHPFMSHGRCCRSKGILTWLPLLPVDLECN